MHACPVDGCRAVVPYEILMCPAHWRLVPAKIKRYVYNEWNNGRPTHAYPRIRQEAIDAVNMKMGSER